MYIKNGNNTQEEFITYTRIYKIPQSQIFNEVPESKKINGLLVHVNVVKKLGNWQYINTVYYKNIS